MSTIKEAASEFLANKRIAVTGVSRSARGHGSNTVYQRLRQRGYEVFSVNPNADQVEGDRSFHDLKSIPGGVDAVVMGPGLSSLTVPSASAPTWASSTSGCIAPLEPGASQRQPRLTGGSEALP